MRGVIRRSPRTAFFSWPASSDRLRLLMAAEYAVVEAVVYGVVRRHHASITGVDRRRDTGGRHVDRHPSAHL